MICSCGKLGEIRTNRREFSYCEECFNKHIVKSIRQEAKDKQVKLKPVQGYFLEAVQAACKKAGREVVLDETGATPGCAELAAAATIRGLFGYTAKQEPVFPKTITLEELQMFFKAKQSIILDNITQELIYIEKNQPGTVNSINKQTR